MEIIIAFMVLFVLMLAGPVIGAALYYKTRKGTVLHINQERIRDARYFGKSFSQMIEKNMNSITGNKIRLSREETFIDGDKQAGSNEKMAELIIAREKEFSPPALVKEFRKEIYSGENAMLSGKGVKVRAIYCKKKMILGYKTQVIRWADAEETLAVYDDCDLGISASAGEQMSIGYHCSFRRLYAPQIRLGQYPDSKRRAEDGKDPKIYRLPIQTSKEKNMRYISKEMINEKGVVDFSVVSWRNVTVTEKIIVQGDIRSHKGVRLCDDAVVCGNIFAEEDVLLGKNAAVLGNIFTQGSVYFEERATAGQRGRISSVIARESITFEGNNFVFGYVSCEKEGKVEAAAESGDMRKLQYLGMPSHLEKLTFKDLYDYEHVDQQGFRGEASLREVVIPSGAASVPDSMFFACKSLERVTFPYSIKRIGNYAFADCYKLKRLKGFSEMMLEEIGTSGFENCRELETVTFTSALRRLGGAAFGGCSSLTDVKFLKHTRLETVGDHCFRGCSRLEELEFPDTVSYIGISAFRGCDSLKKISLPAACSQTPGIAELQETRPEVELLFRDISLKGPGEELEEILAEVGCDETEEAK